MADLLSDGAEFLRDQLAAGCSQTIVYRRGEQFCELEATFGSSLLKVTDSSNRVKIIRTERDFIFSADAFDFGAGPEKPQAGDFVDVRIGEHAERFEVVAPGREPVWRHADPHKLMYRVHAKSRGLLD